MALSLTLGAVSAEDAAADAAAADNVAAVDVAPAADGNAAGGDNVQPVQAEAVYTSLECCRIELWS